MDWRRVRVIARREFWTTVRRREFLLVTFGLPILYFLIGVGVSAATVSAARSSDSRDERRSLPIGWRDQSGLLDPATLTKGDNTDGKLFSNREAGQEAVRTKKIRAFVDVPGDFGKKGEITVYLPPARGSIFSRSASGDPSLVPTIRRALLKNRVPATLAERVVEAPEITRLNFDPTTKRFAESNPLEALSRFAIPYVFSLLLIVAVLFSSSYLLHGIVEEKEARVMEVLLSAASHEDLLLGKLIGLGGAGWRSSDSGSRPAVSAD
jgi:ABC-2 type transport system permease protein